MQTSGSRRASNTFGSLLNTVQNGNSVKVTRNYKDIAAVLSVEDYELLGDEQTRLHKRNQFFEEKHQMLLAELQQGIDDLDKGCSKEANSDFWSDIKQKIAS